MSSLSTDPRLSPRTASLYVTLAAAGLLATVFVMEYGFGIAPCSLCLLQRWPHAVVIPLGALAFVPAISGTLRSVLLLLCAAAFATTAGIGIYHVGVEEGIFAGPSACSGGITGDTVEELRRKLMAAPVIQCNEVAWSLFGISLAGYNVLASSALAVFSAVIGARGLTKR
jgi:disulfide bond formation protein DsbB